MRKTAFLILLAILTGKSVVGQGTFNTEHQDTTNIYRKGLEAFCGYAKKVFPKVKKIYLSDQNRDFWDIPPKCDGIDFEVVTQEQIMDMARADPEKTYFFTRISHLKLKDALFQITVIPFKVEPVNGRLMLVNGGGIRLDFTYDCKMKGLKLVKVDGGFGELK
jgi:hypothetical protein